MTFFTVGDLPRGSFSSIRDELLKPLKQFVQLEHVAIKSTEHFKKRPDQKLIVLDADGKQFTSEEFAQTLSSFEDMGDHIAVLLGGAKGLSDETKESADILLSLSKMTTTHDLAHLFFLEQLYRAMTIAHGKTYHY